MPNTRGAEQMPAGSVGHHSESIRGEPEGDSGLQVLHEVLIAGELSGEPHPFDFTAFWRRKLAQHSA